MLAVLEPSDFYWIFLIVSFVALVILVMGLPFFRPDPTARLRRIEAKLDIVLRHLGLEYRDPLVAGMSPEVQALADDPRRKIAAIKLLREQTGAGLREAKDAVEAYIAGRG